MLIDTSVLIAILLSEPEAPRMQAAIAADPARLVAAPSIVEAAAVILTRKGPQGEAALTELLYRLDLSVVAMSSNAAALARAGYLRFGKGVGSPGILNFGDCLAYGVAMDLGQPLLFKGNDFSRTDVPSVAY
jgi:ribonuclease VapC